MREIRNADIGQIMREAEKVDLDWETGEIRCRYMDGREVVLRDVKIYWPAMVRVLYKQGSVPRQWAINELKKYGLKLKRSPQEPDA